MQINRDTQEIIDILSEVNDWIKEQDINYFLDDVLYAIEEVSARDGEIDADMIIEFLEENE